MSRRSSSSGFRNTGDHLTKQNHIIKTISKHFYLSLYIVVANFMQSNRLLFSTLFLSKALDSTSSGRASSRDLSSATSQNSSSVGIASQIDFGITSYGSVSDVESKPHPRSGYESRFKNLIDKKKLI